MTALLARAKLASLPQFRFATVAHCQNAVLLAAVICQIAMKPAMLKAGNAAIFIAGITASWQDGDGKKWLV